MRAGVFRRRLRKGMRTLGLRRVVVLTLMIVAALGVARYAWHVPLAADAERALYDLRIWALAPHMEQDSRLVLVTYDDNVLASTGKRSPVDRQLMADALTRLDAMGARSIGIDILIDQPQPEDDALATALAGMRTPTYLAFANATTTANSVRPWQEDFQRAFLSRVGPEVQPASVRLEADLDNVIRSWPERQAGDPPLLVDRMMGVAQGDLGSGNSIVYRLPANADQRLFQTIPIDTFTGPVLETELGARMIGSQIAGRHVLIGGDISDVDIFDTPMTRLTGLSMTGLEIHGLLLIQAMDGVRAPAPLPIALWLLAFIVVALAVVHGYGDFGIWNVPILLAELAAILAAPFGLQAIGFDTQTLPAFGWIVGWTLAYAAAAAAARGVGSDQRRFAQATLGRYLPPEIARAIIRDPERLTLTGERRDIYALFSDIEGFTTLTHAIPPETTASLLNAYLDRISDVVLEHGGTIDKFVGDSVVAIWGAPIARETDGDQAVRAAIAIARAGDAFTAARADGGPPMGRTRVGVHRGQAIVGNFGGDGRIQYTALGDVMNTAARLEGANKAMGTQVLISEEAGQGLTGVVLRPLGRVSVRGRPAPLKVFDARPDLTEADAAHVGALIADFEDGRPQAAAALEAYVLERPDDPALAKLFQRLTSVGPGGCYALD